MLRYSLCLLFFLPLISSGALSVIVQPYDVADVQSISNPEQSQEFFGKLESFPHTFEFEVSGPTDLSVQLFVLEAAQENDASLIVIKEERRGVSEVGRTYAKSEAWMEENDTALGLTYRKGGEIIAKLEAGVYRVEVSSPRNDTVYRLVFGTQEIKRGYFENLQLLSDIHTLTGTSKLSIVTSPLIYVPSAFLLLFGALLWMYFKRRSLM